MSKLSKEIGNSYQDEKKNTFIPIVIANLETLFKRLLLLLPDSNTLN